MKEHIKLLKEQAMEWVPNMADPDTKIRLLNAEKFAELIVAETIAVVQKRFMGDLNREDMEVRRCIEDVKKHFGVEE